VERRTVYRCWKKLRDVLEKRTGERESGDAGLRLRLMPCGLIEGKKLSPDRKWIAITLFRKGNTLNGALGVIMEGCCILDERKTQSAEGKLRTKGGSVHSGGGK